MSNNAIFNFPRFIKSRSDLQSVYLRREERVKREGSPSFTYILAALAAAAHIDVDVQKQFPDCRKYEPLDEMVIKNNDVQDLKVSVNGDYGNADVIMAGEMTTYKDKPIWAFRVENIGGAITVLNKIVFILQRSSTSVDAEVRRQYGK
jgi:hypothetical protein